MKLLDSQRHLLRWSVFLFLNLTHKNQDQPIFPHEKIMERGLAADLHSQTPALPVTSRAVDINKPEISFLTFVRSRC